MSDSAFHDWTREPIESNDSSPLFKVLEKERFDANVLKEAISLLKKPVINVQIRVPFPDELKTFITELDNSKLTFVQDLPTDGLARLFGAIDAKQSAEFLQSQFAKQKIICQGSQKNIGLINQWEKASLAIPSAVGQMWQKAAIHTIFSAAQDKHREGMLNPHYHHGPNNQPGYVINLPCATDGTVFLDRKTNTLWFGKGWCYNVFAATGHKDVEPAEHSEPFPLRTKTPESRKTIVCEIAQRL